MSEGPIVEALFRLPDDVAWTDVALAIAGRSSRRSTAVAKTCRTCPFSGSECSPVGQR